MPTCHTVGSRSIYLGVPPRMVLSNSWVDQLHIPSGQFRQLDRAPTLPFQLRNKGCCHSMHALSLTLVPVMCTLHIPMYQYGIFGSYPCNLLSSCTSLGPETRTPDVNEYLLYRSSRPRGREARTQRSIKKCLNSKARIVSRLHIPSTLMNFCSEICGDE